MRDASIAVLRKIGVDTRRLERAVRAQPRRRPHARDRDEPARVALLGARVEGDRLPDRQGRGEARDRLHARRAARTRSRAARRRPRSSRRSTTSSPRSRASRSRNSRRPTDRLTTQMKSVGEVMAIGRTFQESLQKALRGLEIGVDGSRPGHEHDRRRGATEPSSAHELRDAGRRTACWYVGDAFRAGLIARGSAVAHEHRSAGSSRRSRSSSRSRSGSHAEGPGILERRELRRSSARASPTGASRR